MRRFNVLGPVTASVDGVAVDLGSRKQRTVLAVLVVNAGHLVPTDRIIESVWGEDASPSARHSVQTYVSNLRRLLGDGSRELLAGTTDGYRLTIDSGVSTDRIMFGESLAQGSVESLRRALDLWRGDPLEDVEHDWARPDIVSWTEQRLAALESWSSLMIARGQPAASIPELERAAGEYPMRESLWASLMTALAAAGRPVDALGAYQSLRRTLGEELGLEPSPELRDLEARILLEETRGPIDTSKPVGGSLPEDRTRIIGRDAELAGVTQLLAGRRLVSLLGPGGSGKTRLAIAAARHMQEEGEIPVYFVDLSRLSNADQVPLTIAAAIGVGVRHETATRQSVLNQLVAALSARELLVVLDNCEHLIGAVGEVVEAILGASRGVTILVTSREALGISGERRHQVPPLALVEGMHRPALELFTERAEAAAGFVPTADEENVLQEVCRSLDGMPLAIELAAAQLAFLSPSELVEGLSSRLSMSAGRGGDPRHRTLRATMEWSWDLLDDEEALLLQEVAVFAGGWSLEAAQGVCAGGHVAVRDMLGSLVAKSLIQVEKGTWGNRYRLLDTVQLYALERLGDQSKAMRLRHAAWFAEWCDSWSLEEQWGSGDLASQALHDWDNLRGALATHVDNDDMKRAAMIVSACISLWRGSHAAKEALEWTGAVDPTELPPDIKTRWLLSRATACQINDDYESMWAFAEEASAVARTTGRPDLLAMALSTAAFGLLLRDLDDNAKRWEEVLEVAGEAGTLRIEAAAWGMLAVGSYLGGESSERYLPMLDKALSGIGPSGWDRSIAILAAAHLLAPGDELKSARHLFDNQVETLERLGLHFDAARSRLLRAYVMARLGEGEPWAASLRAAHKHFSMAWGSRADPDVLLLVAAWEVFSGDPYRGSELLAAVGEAGLEYPEDYVMYRELRNHLKALELDRVQVAAARRRGAETPVGEALGRELRRLGWV